MPNNPFIWCMPTEDRNCKKCGKLLPKDEPCLMNKQSYSFWCEDCFYLTFTFPPPEKGSQVKAYFEAKVRGETFVRGKVRCTKLEKLDKMHPIENCEDCLNYFNRKYRKLYEEPSAQ